MSYSAEFVKAAKAAGQTPQEFARRIRGLLARGKCRDTRRIFNKAVTRAIS